MANKATIKSVYESGASKREALLETARKMSALTKPWVMPPNDQSGQTSLPENYQSIGSRGMTSATGKSLVTLWTPGAPWLQHKPSAKILSDPSVRPEVIRELQTHMLHWDLTVVSLLEAQNLRRKRGAVGSFRSRKRMALDQMYITGDVLERMDDDFRIRVFRRDQYITTRDSAGDVLQHVTLERVDPAGIIYDAQSETVGKGTNQEFLEKVGLDAAVLDKPIEERMVELYTHVEWNPIAETWVIRQEVNDLDLVESEETVSPYFATAFNLAPGENYGRGLAEENSGDLRTLDETELRLLELLARAAKGLVVKDENSLMRDTDLEKNSGEVIHGRVKGGVVEDVAMLAFGEVREYGMLTDSVTRKEANLGRAFLLDSATQPEGDRVTAAQVRRIAAELDSSTGGQFATVSDQQQGPLAARAIHVAKKQNLLPDYPEDAVDVEVVTGIAALSRDIEFAKATELGALIAQLPEQAQNRINWSIYAEKLFELRTFTAPGIVKTDEQLQQEQAAAQKAALAAQAGSQAIESTGKIAESAAQQQPQGG